MEIKEDNFIQNISGHPRVYKIVTEGKPRFGKFATVSETSTNWKQTWNEFFTETLLTAMGEVELHPEILTRNGMLSVERDDISANWGVKNENPGIVVKGDERFFTNLWICDFLMNQTDRAKGKNEHIGLIPLNDREYIPAAIDNENCLENLESDINFDQAKNHFAFEYITNKDLVDVQIHRLKEIPIATIAINTTVALLNASAFTTGETERIYEFTFEVGVDLQKRRIKLEELVFTILGERFNNSIDRVQAAPI